MGERAGGSKERKRQGKRGGGLEKNRGDRGRGIRDR